jgi:hypothetical protein
MTIFPLIKVSAAPEATCWHDRLSIETGVDFGHKLYSYLKQSVETQKDLTIITSIVTAKR